MQDGIHEILDNLHTTDNSLNNIPDYLLNILIEFYSSLNTTSPIDLETPHLRPVFRYCTYNKKIIIKGNKFF